MGTVHTLRQPRRLDPEFIRPAIEDAIQGSLDAADKMIALLDLLDGDADQEDGGDSEPSLGAPEGHESQVVYFRGGSRDCEHDHTPAA